jgi:DNA-binding MarR family transcriptional regulator
METRILRHFDWELKKDFVPSLPVELNNKEVELILILKRFPRMPMSFYGNEVQLERGSFTYLSGLLQTKGIIMKLDNLNDSRSSLLELTAHGNDLAHEIRRQLEEHIHRRLAVFSEHDRMQLEFVIETTKYLLSKLAEKPFLEMRRDDEL